MANYIPLITLVVTVVGGIEAFSCVAPVRPPRREPQLRMVLHERGHLNAFGYRWHTTPPGDPTIFGPLTTERYTPPTTFRPARLHTIGTFTSPPPPPTTERAVA